MGQPPSAVIGPDSRGRLSHNRRIAQVNFSPCLRNGSGITSLIDLEHAAERHEDRSHAGAWERVWSAREWRSLEFGKLFPTRSLGFAKSFEHLTFDFVPWPRQAVVPLWPAFRHAGLEAVGSGRVGRRRGGLRLPGRPADRSIDARWAAPQREPTSGSQLPRKSSPPRPLASSTTSSESATAVSMGV